LAKEYPMIKLVLLVRPSYMVSIDLIPQKNNYRNSATYSSYKYDNYPKEAGNLQRRCSDFKGTAV
jgi:hypothetical protein